MAPFGMFFSPTDCQERAALRIGCIKKMKEMDSKRHDQTPTTDLQPVNQLDEWRLVLLTQLSELHEEQDSEVLSSLIDEVSRQRCEIQRLPTG